MRSNSSFTDVSAAPAALNSIRNQMAYTLIGRTVDLLADTSTVAHGVVTGVLTDCGIAKLVVGGTPYNLNQVLTVTPASMN